MLNKDQLKAFRSILNTRNEVLREEIRQELLDSDEEHFIDLAGQVHDLAEESVADLFVDLHLAIIDARISEIRAIESALVRLAKGEFGYCVHCQDEIEMDRLRAYPSAQRCQPCQAKFEHSHMGFRRASL